MPEQVDIPLSALNVVPGVSGLEDVQFEVPTPEDQREIVRDELEQQPTGIQEEDIDEIVQRVEERAGIDGDAIGDALSAELPAEIQQTDIDIGGGIFGPTEDDIADAFDSALGGAVGGIGEALAELQEEQQTLAERLTDDEQPEPRRDIVLAAAGAGFVDLPGVSRQEAVDRLPDDLPLPDEVGPSPLEQAIPDGLADVAESAASAPVDILAQPIEVIQQAVLDIEPAINDNGLFTDAPGFVSGAVDDVTGGLVDDDPRANLQASVDRLERVQQQLAEDS
jgi:hypothetical protein